MSATNRPYEQFGSFLLFKRLENDSLGELWRAARIEGKSLGPTVALRRLLHGSRAALQQSAEAAQPLAPLLTGTSFAKDQEIDLIDGVPTIVHEYAGGRSLRHIVDRARGGTNSSANPIPLDQAIVIAEKIALSLATTADLRYLGKNLAHGGLIPQFVWITDEGETRVAGQQLGPGLVASLSNPTVAAEISRYFAPEYRTSGSISKTTDVYSLGAILYLLITANEPPEATTGSGFTQIVRAARTTTGEPIPEDLRTILEKSLAIDPAQRFASIGDMKQAISAITHGGKHAATTFNLAFYLSTLLKKELEGENIDREREAKVNLQAYLQPATPPPAPAIAIPAPPPRPVIDERPMFSTVESPKSNRTAMMAVAAAVLLLGGGGAWFLLHQPAASKPVVAATAPKPAPPKPVVIPPPVVTVGGTTSTATATSTSGSADPAAEKKAFELAVQQKLQEEMLKLQSDYNEKLKQQQSKNAPVQMASAAPPPSRKPQPEESGSSSSAAAFDQRRVSSRPETATVAAPAPTQTQSLAAPPPAAATPQPVAAAPAPTVHEGDVVEMTDLDAAPQPLSPIHADYPRLAMQQHAKTTVILSALISETGSVQDVKILRGDARFGFNDAAVRAMKNARFTAPMKAGKHVRTWRPQTFAFAF